MTCSGGLGFDCMVHSAYGIRRVCFSLVNRRLSGICLPAVFFSMAYYPGSKNMARSRTIRRINPDNKQAANGGVSIDSIICLTK